MEMIALLVVFLLGYLVSWIQWYQPERAKVQSLFEDLRWARSKVKAQQLDLDRWSQKNRSWAEEVVDRVMQSEQEWPRAQGWKKYQESQTAQEQASELNRESDRQQAERNRWLQE